MRLIASVVRATGFVAAGFLVVGALLYVLEANESNWLVATVMDIARWFADPFRGIFELEQNKAQVIINWGIGAIVYIVLAVLLAAAIQRLAVWMYDRRRADASRAREA